MIHEELDVATHFLVLVNDPEADTRILPIEVASQRIECRPIRVDDSRLVRIRKQRIRDPYFHAVVSVVP